MTFPSFWTRLFTVVALSSRAVAALKIWQLSKSHSAAPTELSVWICYCIGRSIELVEVELEPRARVSPQRHRTAYAPRAINSYNHTLCGQVRHEWQTLRIPPVSVAPFILSPGLCPVRRDSQFNWKRARVCDKCFCCCCTTLPFPPQSGFPPFSLASLPIPSCNDCAWCVVSRLLLTNGPAGVFNFQIYCGCRFTLSTRQLRTRLGASRRISGCSSFPEHNLASHRQ